MKKTLKTISAIFTALIFTISASAQKPSSRLLTPTNHTLVLIDYEGQMSFATKSIDMSNLRDNVALIAGGSKIFNVPTVVTTVAEKSFSGPVFPEITEFYPNTDSYIDRTSMNTWEDEKAHAAIVAKGKKKIVLGGLWTEVCIVGPALSAIAEGYEVYVITDASGGVSNEAHAMAIQRIIQAGAQPMTSTQYVLELQRDWARQETYVAVTSLFKKYGGAYGLGILYGHEMLKH
ncbi:hydrolase [Chitinophaga sp. CF418]|uniref:hydrolase n=1 Tax=Chitinophaga sp. CF418 TaxID=1855287 RepID=UPI00091ECB56|nr:hydrolase [Chitinophaga sp. CF418]SHM85351.1 Nicotinamidase-related amidase [Chitinophaga sp. CF418]